jgi:hypothetical protein
VGGDRLASRGDLDDAPVELLRPAGIAIDPIPLRAVRGEEKQEGRSLDVVLLEDGLSGGIAPDGPEEDKVILKILGVVGLIVVLLTQQYAAPSARLDVKVDEDGLAGCLGLGQGFVP